MSWLASKLSTSSANAIFAQHSRTTVANLPDITYPLSILTQQLGVPRQHRQCEFQSPRLMDLLTFRPAIIRDTQAGCKAISRAKRTKTRHGDGIDTPLHKARQDEMIAAMPSHDPYASLRLPNYRRYFIGNFLSNYGPADADHGRGLGHLHSHSVRARLGPGWPGAVFAGDHAVFAVRPCGRSISRASGLSSSLSW